MERKVFEDHRQGGYAEVWHVAYPAILTMFSQTIMSFTDAVMVGRLGAAELAGVGFAGTMVWGLYSFFNGMVNGVNVFVAQDYGAKRYRHIGTMTWQGIYIAIASGAILFLLSEFSGDIFRFVGPEASIQRIGSAYLGLRMRGGAFIVLWMCFSAFLRGLGDTRTPLKITLVANVINIAGDYVLIFGKLGFPRLETQGAAIATVFANGVGAALFFVVFLAHKRAVLYGIRSEWRLKVDALKRLAKVGGPIGLQWMLDMGSFIVFSALIARMGIAQLAGHEAALRLMHLSFMPVFGLSIASTTLVGQYIGSDELPKAIRSGHSSLKMGFLYTLFIGTVFMVFPDELVALINSDPEVVRLGSSI
ncbi:MAG: MATE family efflux transporter, partial [bacterium]